MRLTCRTCKRPTDEHTWIDLPNTKFVVSGEACGTQLSACGTPTREFVLSSRLRPVDPCSAADLEAISQ